MYLKFVTEVGFLFKDSECIHLLQSRMIVEFDCTIPHGVSPKSLTTTLYYIYIVSTLALIHIFNEHMLNKLHIIRTHF